MTTPLLLLSILIAFLLYKRIELSISDKKTYDEDMRKASFHLQKYSFNDLLKIYSYEFIEKYGPHEYNKLVDEIYCSYDYNSLFKQSLMNIESLNALNILYAINSKPKYMIKQTSSQKLIALLVLRKWHDELNHKFKYLGLERINEIARDIEIQTV